MTDKGEKGSFTRLAKRLGDKHGFDVKIEPERDQQKKGPKLTEEKNGDPNRTGPKNWSWID